MVCVVYDIIYDIKGTAWVFLNVAPRCLFDEVLLYIIFKYHIRQHTLTLISGTYNIRECPLTCSGQYTVLIQLVLHVFTVPKRHCIAS